MRGGGEHACEGGGHACLMRVHMQVVRLCVCVCVCPPSPTCTVSLSSRMMAFTTAGLLHLMRRSRGPLSVWIWRSRQLSGPGLAVRRWEGSHFFMTSYGNKLISWCRRGSGGGQVR